MFKLNPISLLIIICVLWGGSMGLRSVEFSNLIIKFGADENLIEHFENRVWPHLIGNIDIKRGEIKGYKFLSRKIAKFGGEVYVYGRLLKLLDLKARQRLQNNKLVSTSATLKSDVSSVYFLRLHDHKLFVIPEQPRSPKPSEFKTVLKRSMDQQWGDLLDEYNADYLAKMGRKRFKKGERAEIRQLFLNEFPRPSIEINPIGSKFAVNTLMKKFAKVKSLRLEFNLTNFEDYETAEELIEKFGEANEALNSKKGIQSFTNNSEGLDIDNASDLVEASTETGGNCQYRIKGDSKEGEKLDFTDQDSRAKGTIEVRRSENFQSLFEKVYAELNRHIENGAINFATPRNLRKLKSKAIAIFNSLKER